MLSLVNRAVHRCYTDRVESLVHRTGLYAPLYGVYQRLVGLAYGGDRHRITVDGETVAVHMVHDPEVLSILHTLEKERELIEAFGQAVQPGDLVWDVGANLGLYSLVAAAQGADVVAFEPHPVTAGRLRENAALNDLDVRVDEVALGRETRQATLAVDRDELGTQTPSVATDDEGSIPIHVRRGADLAPPAPDVVKVDVEGAEAAVFDGLGEVLEDVETIVCESHGSGEISRLREEGWRLETVVDGRQPGLVATQ